jgi:hypothetical protein
MSTHVKVSGVWKTVDEIYVKILWAWESVSAKYVKVDGTWKKSYEPRIPFNMVALFTSAIENPWKPLSYNLFPLGANAEGGTNLYSNTHPHTGDVTVSHATSSSVSDDAIVRSNIIAAHGSSHNYTHNHSDLDHQPPWQSWRAATAHGSYVLPSGALLFFNGSTIPTGWSRGTYTNGKFVKLDSYGEGDVGGNSTHTHSHPNSTNHSGYVAHQVGTTYNRIVNPGTHNHTVPDHTAVNNLPPFINLDMVTPNSDWTQPIPSGIIAFFVGSVVPSGWSVYSAALGKFVKLDSTAIETTGGSNSHSHVQNEASGSYSGTVKVMGADGYTSAPRPHSHTVTHTHSAVTNNSMPLARELLICKKD